MIFLHLIHPNKRPAKRLIAGFSLIELLVCLGVVGVIAAFGLPSLQRLQERSSVEAARDQLINDLQTARLKALQQGQALQLSRISTCSWRTSALTDWSCGWQLKTKLTSGLVGELLLDSPLHQQLTVTFAKTDPLEINRRADLGTVGERWVIKSRNTNPANPVIAMTICINSASRVRWQTGEACS